MNPMAHRGERKEYKEGSSYSKKRLYALCSMLYALCLPAVGKRFGIQALTPTPIN